MLGLDEQTLERRSLARNEVLFRQGDKVAAIYFVEAGRLRLERRTFDGRLLVLGTTPAGEFFVVAALFSDTFHCDAVAAEPSQLRVYPKAAVLNVLSTDPTSAMSFLTLMAHQVMELRQRLELNAESDRRTVNLRCQLQDIAGELGLTREAFYRTLASLERASVIERAGD